MFVVVIHCRNEDSPNYMTKDGLCADIRTAKTFEDKGQAVKEAKELNDEEIEYVWIGEVVDIRSSSFSVFVEELLGTEFN